MNTQTNGSGPGLVTPENDYGLTTQHSQPAKSTTQTTAPIVGNLIAKMALKGHVVIRGDRGDFTSCAYGLTRYCKDIAELAAFARKVGAV